jgi:hypothetical protein
MRRVVRSVVSLAAPPRLILQRTPLPNPLHGMECISVLAMRSLNNLLALGVAINLAVMVRTLQLPRLAALAATREQPLQPLGLQHSHLRNNGASFLRQHRSLQHPSGLQLKDGEEMEEGGRSEEPRPALLVPACSALARALNEPRANRVGGGISLGTSARGSASVIDDCCPICMDAFALRDQVLLSCSHAFHASCIESFERYVGTDRRACPVCRAGQYQKRRVRQGARLHVFRCILRAQALFRGRAARKRLFALRKARYMPDATVSTLQPVDAGSAAVGVSVNGGAAGVVDEARKAAFVASALGDLNRRLHLASSKREGRIDSLFDSLDKCVTLLLPVFSLFSPLQQQNPLYGSSRRLTRAPAAGLSKQAEQCSVLLPRDLRQGGGNQFRQQARHLMPVWPP